MPIPRTATRTDHAMVIQTEGGSTIGLIQDWTPAQARTVTPTYMLASEFSGTKDPNFDRGTYYSGEIFEQVPGNISGLTITVNRYDLFKSKMEEAFGSITEGAIMNMLTDQTFGLTLKEFWKDPSGDQSKVTYHHCWFTSLGRTHSASGDRIVKVNASLVYTWKSLA